MSKLFIIEEQYSVFLCVAVDIRYIYIYICLYLNICKRFFGFDFRFFWRSATVICCNRKPFSWLPSLSSRLLDLYAIRSEMCLDGLA